MTLLIWASVLLFCQSAEARSASFAVLPMSVSPLPSAPWHEAHLAFQVRTVFASTSARAAAAEIRMTSTILENTRIGKASWREIPPEGSNARIMPAVDCPTPSSVLQALTVSRTDRAGERGGGGPHSSAHG